MPASTFFRNAICNLLRGTAISAIGGFVALFNGDPSAAGVEVTTTIRAAGRVAITFGAPTNGTMSNSAAVNFGNSAGNATITHFAIFDAASAGNQIFWGPLAASQTITTGNPVNFPIGSLTNVVT